MCGLAMGPVPGCPFGQGGVCETNDGGVDQSRDYVVLPHFDFDADLSEFGRSPTSIR